MKNKMPLADAQTHKFAPGPSVASNFWEDALSSFAALTLEYGDVVCLDPDKHRIYLINHPDHIKHVLQENNRNYRKDADSFKLVVGEGLLISEGDFWLRQRRMMQPAFHRQSLENMFDQMVSATAGMLQRWQKIAENDGTIDIFTEMTDLTINISASTMFGVDMMDDARPLANALAIAQDYVYYQGWDYPQQAEQKTSAEYIQFTEAINTIDRIVYDIINKRRASKESRSDLLAMLLDATDEKTGHKMTEKQLRDEVVTMLAGGQSTTAIALTWIWYAISIHPEVEIRLYAELLHVLSNASITFQDLHNLGYTRMVIDEVLRLYPPAWLTARLSHSEDQIGGYYIPENSEIFISPYLTHRHPTFWKNPEHFDPERFSPDTHTERAHFAYLPFSGGPHMCIGNGFAILTIQVVLAMVENAYQLSLVTEAPVHPQARILLQPDKSIEMKLRKREA